jgi:YggT family protein
MTYAITRVDVAAYLNALIWIYTILILIRILLTWIPNLPENPVLRGAVGFIEDVTEPYLAIWRRLIPPLNAGGMLLDLSVIAAVVVLQLAGGIIVALIHG